jgi:hypothetical protein
MLYPGAATDIGVGSNGSVWVVGTNPVGGGFGIWQWIGRWSPVPGGAIRITVDSAGLPWVANTTHNVYHWNGRSWTIFSGRATDIAAGANGSLWVVGDNPVRGGFGVWHWTGTAWASLPAGAARIAVDPLGNSWIVNSSREILSSGS